MDTVELPQGRIEYRVAGNPAPADSTAPPVVFIHGLLVNGELWTQAADALAARGIRSYAPNLPIGSHAIPLNPDADLAPRDIARLINDFLDALGLDDVTLVGSDTGGALCQFLIDTDHSRIGRLVLTNCDAFDEFPPAPFGLLVKAGRHPRLVKTLMGQMRLKAIRHSMLGYGGLAALPLDPELTRRWITPALTNADVRRDLAKFLREVRPADLLDVSTRLGRFDKPVQLVWGDADPFFKIGFARRLKEAFPNASLSEVAGGRTFVSLDEPERLADEIVAAFYPAA